MVLSLALTNGASGLSVAQKAQETISNNIANVNTPGYSRKVMVPQSVSFGGVGYGVANGGIIRYVDEALNRNIRSQVSELEYLRQSDSYFTRLQNLLGTTGSSSSISHRIGDLAAAIQGLAAAPSDSTQQISVARSLEDVAYLFNQISQSVSAIRTEADQDIAESVQLINNYINNIHQLNRDIGKGNSLNQDVTTLLDQRDYQLQLLNEQISVRSMDLGDGQIGIFTSGGAVLLDAQPHRLVHTAVSASSSVDSYAGGAFGSVTVIDPNGVYIAGEFFSNNQDITSQLTGGRVGAAISMRDKTGPDYLAQMDELAVQLKNLVNQVHNQGTSYPTLATQMSGTQKFIDPTLQTMQFLGGTDSNIILIRPDGTQLAAASVSDIMAAAGFDMQGGGGPVPTVQDVASELQNWLQAQQPSLSAAEFTFDPSSNTFNIDLHTNDFGLGFADVDAQGDHIDFRGNIQDSQIGWDIDGDGFDDKTVSGFSSFFGLNDVFLRSGQNYIFDSGVRTENWRVNSAAGTLDFLVSGGSLGTITVGPNDSLQSIANRINSDPVLSQTVRAEFVPEGEGYRLRIKNILGDDMEIVQQGATNITDALGLGHSNAGASGQISVNPVLVGSPERITTGTLNRDRDTGAYSISGGDNSVVRAMNASLNREIYIPSAGGLTAGTRTIGDYASLIMADNSFQANDIRNRYNASLAVANQLLIQQGTVSGVDINEEFAQLIIYQKMFQASAKVVSTSSDMLDVLISIVR